MSGEFQGEEVTQLLGLVDALCSDAPSRPEPELVICTGTVGAGKTTFRRREFGRGYAQLDFLEALVAATRALGRDHPRLADFVRASHGLAVERAIASRNSVVIELVDDALVLPLLEPMKGIGYRNVLQHLTLDPAEGYRRHTRAVQQDPEYMSSFFTEESTLEPFYRHFDLDPAALERHAEAKEL